MSVARVTEIIPSSSKSFDGERGVSLRKQVADPTQNDLVDGKK